MADAPESVGSAQGSNGSPTQGRSRGTSSSSDWTSTCSSHESTPSADSEGKPEEVWLRRMLTGAQMPTTGVENDQDIVMNDLEALEYGLKMICFAKITEAVEAASRVRAAMEQLMRVQAKEKEQNRQRMLILEQYKDIGQKLAIENSLLKEQLASFKATATASASSKGGQMVGRPSPAARGESTANADSVDDDGITKPGKALREVKEEAAREIGQEDHNNRQQLVVD